MRRFLVIFKEIPIDRISVKSGQISREVVTACRCVNVGLFVSGNIRRDVIVSIASGTVDDLKIVSYSGPSLKRVSPDERSISFFLLKAREKIEDLEPEESFIMDNGIELTRSSLERLNEMWSQEIIRVPSTNQERFILDTNLAADRAEEAP